MKRPSTSQNIRNSRKNNLMKKSYKCNSCIYSNNASLSTHSGCKKHIKIKQEEKVLCT